MWLALKGAGGRWFLGLVPTNGTCHFISTRVASAKEEEVRVAEAATAVQRQLVLRLDAFDEEAEVRQCTLVG